MIGIAGPGQGWYSPCTIGVHRPGAAELPRYYLTLPVPGRSNRQCERRGCRSVSSESAPGEVAAGVGSRPARRPRHTPAARDRARGSRHLSGGGASPQWPVFGRIQSGEPAPEGWAAPRRILQARRAAIARPVRVNHDVVAREAGTTRKRGASGDEDADARPCVAACAPLPQCSDRLAHWEKAFS